MRRAATISAAGTPVQTARLPPSCCCPPSSASSTSPDCLSWYSHPDLHRPTQPALFNLLLVLVLVMQP